MGGLGLELQFEWNGLVQITGSLCSLVSEKTFQPLAVRLAHITGLDQWVSGKSDVVISTKGISERLYILHWPFFLCHWGRGRLHAPDNAGKRWQVLHQPGSFSKCVGYRPPDEPTSDTESEEEIYVCFGKPMIWC